MRPSRTFHSSPDGPSQPRGVQALTTSQGSFDRFRHLEACRMFRTDLETVVQSRAVEHPLRWDTEAKSTPKKVPPRKWSIGGLGIRHIQRSIWQSGDATLGLFSLVIKCVN